MCLSHASLMDPYPSSNSRLENWMARTGASTRGTYKISLAKGGRLYNFLIDCELCLLAVSLAHSALICLQKNTGKEKNLWDSTPSGK